MTSAYPHGIDAERAAEYRRRGWWSEEMLADHVARCAAERPDRPAYVSPDASLTWAAYDAASSRLAGALLALGLEPFSRVAIQLPDAITVHVALLACEKAG